MFRTYITFCHIFFYAHNFSLFSLSNVKYLEHFRNTHAVKYSELLALSCILLNLVNCSFSNNFNFLEQFNNSSQEAELCQQVNNSTSKKIYINQREQINYPKDKHTNKCKE